MIRTQGHGQDKIPSGRKYKEPMREHEEKKKRRPHQEVDRMDRPNQTHPPSEMRSTWTRPEGERERDPMDPSAIGTEGERERERKRKGTG